MTHHSHRVQKKSPLLPQILAFASRSLSTRNRPSRAPIPSLLLAPLGTRRVYFQVGLSRLFMLKADYFICPDCGAEVRVGSRGCTRCASERATKSWGKRKPWEQDETHDGLDLPDEEFNYEDFLNEEFGGGRKKSALDWVWWTTALVLVIALAAGYILVRL